MSAVAHWRRNPFPIPTSATFCDAVCVVIRTSTVLVMEVEKISINQLSLELANKQRLSTLCSALVEQYVQYRPQEDLRYCKVIRGSLEGVEVYLTSVCPTTRY